jgi:hypothetical protein
MAWLHFVLVQSVFVFVGQTLTMVLVSSRTSSVYHVFELDFKLPRFCMYIPVVGLLQVESS